MQLPEDYKTDAGFDPCEDHIGPFYYREEGGSFRYAFIVEKKHCNTSGIVHGGVLMTFADFCLCMQATHHYQDEYCTTVSFSGDFVAAGQLGHLIECEAEVTRKTGSLVFVVGKVFAQPNKGKGKGESGGQGEVVFTFSAVVKRLKKIPDISLPVSVDAS